MSENKFPKAYNMYIAKKDNGEHRFYKIVGTAFVQFHEGGAQEKCYVGKPLDDKEADYEYFKFGEAHIVDRVEMLSLVGFPSI